MNEQEQQLYNQFLQLVSISQNMQQRIISLENANQILLKSQRKFTEWMDDTLEDIEYYRNNVYFEIMDHRNIKNLEEFWYPQIASREETIERLLYDHASIARFGDGEFATIQGRIRHKFQTVKDEQLANRLKEVLDSNKKNMLIAIADNYGNLDQYTGQAKREIRHYMTRYVRREHLNLLRRDRLYYDAYITRPYVMYADHQTNAPAFRFEQIRKIWNGRDCIFVEGNRTGMGVGNPLFANAKSVQRILAPAENAFSRYQPVLDFCLKQSKNSLFLLALGPTASVLAYDLYQAGYQAIDIGHIDLEYEWFLKGDGRRTFVEGKYNNEIAGGENTEAIGDKEYLDQVIADFSKM